MKSFFNWLFEREEKEKKYVVVLETKDGTRMISQSFNYELASIFVDCVQHQLITELKPWIVTSGIIVLTEDLRACYIECED